MGEQTRLQPPRPSRVFGHVPSAPFWPGPPLSSLVCWVPFSSSPFLGQASLLFLLPHPPPPLFPFSQHFVEVSCLLVMLLILHLHMVYTFPIIVLGSLQGEKIKCVGATCHLISFSLKCQIPSDLIEVCFTEVTALVERSLAYFC